MAIDFKRIFDNVHIPTRNTSRNWTNCNCPFCVNPKDTHFNGGFNILSPRYNCWRCGGHSWYDALSLILNIPVNQVSSFIKSYTFVSKEKDVKKTAQAEHLELPGYRLDDFEKEYLKGRGFDVDYLQSKFFLRGGGKTGEWAFRILIPIYYRNVLVSWTGRSILDRKTIKEMNIPRYKNLSVEQSVINPKEICFNCDSSNKDSVMLVEGPFDVLKMGDDTICSLGTGVTPEQVLFLKNRYKKIFICFDNEPAAQEHGREVGKNLASVGVDVELVNICSAFNKNDPGELDYNEVIEIKKELEFL